jgi:hypothetical protein
LINCGMVYLVVGGNLNIFTGGSRRPAFISRDLSTAEVFSGSESDFDSEWYCFEFV